MTERTIVTIQLFEGHTHSKVFWFVIPAPIFIGINSGRDPEFFNWFRIPASRNAKIG